MESRNRRTLGFVELLDRVTQYNKGMSAKGQGGEEQGVGEKEHKEVQKGCTPWGKSKDQKRILKGPQLRRNFGNKYVK